MRAIIIDDESRARDMLRAMLRDFCEGVDIVGDAQDVPSAVAAIQALCPDLVFLDVEMPGYSGFQLFDFFERPSFKVIFTTAYSEYAVQAFEVAAIDYLLKPIQVPKLRRAIEKAKAQPLLEKAQLELAQEQAKGGSRRLALPVAEGVHFATLDDILYFQAEGSYTKVVFAQQPALLVSRALKDFEDILPDGRFFRAHRSYIIHMDGVQQYSKTDGGTVTMRNGEHIPLARNRREPFLQAFNIL